MQADAIQTLNDQIVVSLLERVEPALTPTPTQMRIQMQAASLNQGELIIGYGLHGKSGVPQLLINGATSGVGVAALQMAKALGAQVIGTSGSADKLAKLQGQGQGQNLDLAIVSTQADFHATVMQATQNQGVHLVVNTVGCSVFAEDIRGLGFEGRLAVVGDVDGVKNGLIKMKAPKIELNSAL